MTAPEARWKAYCVRHPEVGKEHSIAIGHISSIVRMGKNTIVLRDLGAVVIGKLRADGFTVVDQGDGVFVISW